MDSPTPGPTLRRRPSIHRSWNSINLTDDQKQTKMSEQPKTLQSAPNSPLTLHPKRVSNVENEDSMHDSDQESWVDKDENLSVETQLEDEEELLEITNTTNPLLENSGSFNDSYANVQPSHSEDKYNNRDKGIVTFVIIFFACLSSLLGWWGYERQNSFDLQSLKRNFPTQDEDLWIAFAAGVEDVVQRQRPSTFILLYEEEAQETLTELVYKLSKAAACNITDCTQEPIEVTDAELNSPLILRDYGRIIEKYRHILEEKGVMVIKNLENVRGTSAQAFHSFCDEFTPLVHKSLFIFTVKVDELPGFDKMRFVEEYFRRKWTDIKIDTFNALITRITGMVLEVRT